MAVVERSAQVTAETCGRIDRVVQALTGRSRSDVRGVFAHDCVWLNGAPCDDPGQVVALGDVVLVRHDPARRYREQARERGSKLFRVVFEDDDILVADKGAGVLTVPTERSENNTLVDLLTEHVRRRRRGGRVELVHRLDRETSGLLVFAKHPRAAKALRDQFRTRSVEREYTALVAGVLSNASGTFDTRMTTSKSLKRYSVGDDEEGERAVTHYRVERQLRDAAVVKAWLETGRRNQIRVHFAEAGHPVLGDDRYEAKKSTHPQWTARRLALHATALGFNHPRTGEVVRFESSLPEEFARFLAAVR